MITEQFNRDNVIVVLCFIHFRGSVTVKPLWQLFGFALNQTAGGSAKPYIITAVTTSDTSKEQHHVMQRCGQ